MNVNILDNMKKIIILLVMLAVNLSILAQTTNYKYTLNDTDEESVKAAKTCVNILKRWNEGINRHAANEVSHCFGNVAFYYSDCYEQGDIAKSLNSIFKKYPSYKQTLSDIDVKIINENHVEIYFNKNVKTSPDAQTKTYPAYLTFDYYGDGANIKKESDLVTDNNLEKKQKNLVQVNNATPLSALFCQANVNKYVQTGYWELVGFGSDDVKEGPIASAIVKSTGFARSTMFGPIHKGYKGQPNTYYVGGHCAGGQSGWYVIFVYDSVKKTMRAINCE